MDSCIEVNPVLARCDKFPEWDWPDLESGIHSVYMALRSAGLWDFTIVIPDPAPRLYLHYKGFGLPLKPGADVVQVAKRVKKMVQVHRGARK